MFNRHRLKRKWGRGVKKASNLIRVRNHDKILKDFSWHRRKNNPFWRDENDKINWKKVIEVTLLTICLVGTIILMIFAPVFHINSLQISGLKRVKYTEVENTVNGVLNYHRFLFCPGNNYFLLNLNEISDVLKEKFSLSNVSVKKVFPNKLAIEVREKISMIIYDNGTEYSHIDIEGRPVKILKKVGQDEWKEEKKTVTSTDATGKEVAEIKIISRQHNPKLKDIITEFGDYPIVFDERGITTTIGIPVLRKETVVAIIEWFNKLNTFNTLEIDYFVIKNELGEVDIKTGEGWVIYAQLKKDIDNQFNELQFLLKNKIKSSKINYIDLRFPGKAYWK